jgi:HlyD family secretion protein
MTTMQIRRWLLGGLAVAAVAATLAWAFAPRPVAVETAAVTRGRFEATLDDDAKTRVRERYVVGAPLAGQLQRIALREGDAVQAGDVLAVIAPTLAPLLDERTRREQQLRVEAARANLDRAAAQQARAQVALTQAEHDAGRSEALARQGYVAGSRLDSDRLAAQAAAREVDAAAQARRVAQHELRQAEAALQAVQQPAGAARAFVLRAPVAARVLRVAQASEGTVAPGTPLLELGDTAALEVVAELLSTDALQVAPGARVVIERWGGPGTLEGRVRRVEPAAFTKVSALGVEEQRVRVLIDITSARERWQALGDGYRVAVRVVQQQADDALLVPVSAVFPSDEGEGVMAVFRLEGGRAVLQPVTVNGRNGRHAWVASGLQPGQTVIVYPPGDLKGGARVRARNG